MTVRNEIAKSLRETVARSYEGGGILVQDVDRPSSEPTRLGAVKHAAKLVVAANPRLQ